MKVIETIPYYLVDVRFQDNEIQIYDMLSKKVIALTFLYHFRYIRTP